MNRSFSQLFISQDQQQEYRKKQKFDIVVDTTRTTRTLSSSSSSAAVAAAATNEINSITYDEERHGRTTTMDENNGEDDDHQQQEQSYRQEENHEEFPENLIKKYQPQFVKLSYHVFKRMLHNVIPDNGQLIECLDTDEKLLVVRQIAEIINNLHYYELQQDSWKAYFNFAIRENIWPTTPIETTADTASEASEGSEAMPATSTTPTSTTTTAAAATNSNFNQSSHFPTYFLPKHIIEQRQRTIANRIGRIKNRLLQCLTDSQRNMQRWEPAIDFERLQLVIYECVSKNQQRLKQHFEYRKEITELDFYDRRAVARFYGLKPNEEQVCFPMLTTEIIDSCKIFVTF